MRCFLSYVDERFSETSSDILTRTILVNNLEKSNINKFQMILVVSHETTSTTFICQNGRKPERATARQSWLLTKETQIKHKHY